MKPQIITGETKLIGLLGHPVTHSLSPLIQNHIFASLNLNIAYIPIDVTSENIQTAVQSLRAFRFLGANVTIPHKQAVLPYCDVLSKLSQLTQTVNTLYFSNDLLYGTTTDWEGFKKALEFTGYNPNNKNIVILGNGGIARTIGIAMAYYKIPSKITFIGRDLKKLNCLSKEIFNTTGFNVQTDIFDSKNLENIFSECSLCINCTSVGMYPDIKNSPLKKSLLHKNMMVFDTVYNPSKTMLCQYAEEAGCKFENGLRMLVYQGLASIFYWTNMNIKDDIIDFNELERIISEKNKQNF
jgi:shikimate dehydrogenase